VIEGQDDRGMVSGQTHTDYPMESGEMAVWAHPIDLHLATTNVQGWPKLLMQVRGVEGGVGGEGGERGGAEIL
jgi:hypothetical protein